MEQRIRFAFCVVAASIVLLFTSSVFAQWNIVHTRANVYSSFFFNEFTGLIGINEGILKTTDGGTSWTKANLPGGYNGGQVTQIFMTNELRGWATIEDAPTSQSILKTTDGGLNWVAVGPVGMYNNIYETPTAVIALSRNNQFGSPLYPTLYSTDHGASFQPTTLVLKNGIDFVDDLNGVITSFTDAATTVWMTTSNGGTQWTPANPPEHVEAWSVYGVKGSSIFYAAPETDPFKWSANPVSSIFRSADYGVTWTSTKLNFLSTGHIAGFGEMLYVQTDREKNPAIIGLFRSTDKGVSWTSIGGPSNARDTRFSVTGCNGGVVYAFDEGGNVWKTRNGGDGQIFEPPVKPQVFGSPVVFSSLICDTSDASINIQNLYCTEDTIISAEVSDTTSDLFKSGALSISVMPSFPLVLAPNSKDSIRFTWKPVKLFHTDTTVTIQVRIKYFSRVLGQFFDTTVTVSVHAIGAAPTENIIPPVLNFGTIPFCIPHDTSFTIINTGCDTLFILNALGSAPQNYQVLDASGNVLQFPIAIPPSGNEKIIIRLSLTSSGSYSSDLTLKLRHQGIAGDSSIHIAAVITSTATFESSVADTLFHIHLTRCDTAIPYPIRLSNPGCKNIRVLSAALQGTFAPDVSISGDKNLPQDISNGSTISLIVTATPKSLGTYAGFVHIKYQIDNVIHDTLLSYSLTVGYGTRILATDRDTIDLGRMRLCDEKDSVVLLKDIGCDSLNLFNFTIQGNGVFSLTGTPPLNLAATETSRVPFHFVPIGAGNILGTLTITSNSDTLPNRIVYIIAHVVPTDTMTFSIAPTHTDFYAGDTLSVLMVPQQNVHNKGLYTLQFTVGYNGDLLSLLPGAAGATVLTANMAITGPTMGGSPKHTTATYALIGNPTLEFDSLAPALQFHFSATLTDSITTTFTLTDVKLNGGDSVYQRCNLGIVSASLFYELSLRCGDSMLVRYMQLGNNLKIFAASVYPNPLSETNDFQASVPFRVAMSGNYGMVIFDQLGRMVASKQLSAQSAGAYNFTIDGKSLAAGCYTYLLQEISNSSSAVRGRFIIVR